MADSAPKDSILNTTKQMLNAPVDYDVFDVDILTHINTVFAILCQMGVGPKTPLYITDNTSVWSEFDVGGERLSMARTYMVMKVRLMFDLPPTSFSIEATKELCSELEWRLNVESDV